MTGGNVAEINQIVLANNLSNPNLILSGQTLQVPGAATTTAQLTSAPDPAPAPAPAPSSSSGSVTAQSSFEACVIQRESTGNPTAVNPVSGAAGLYQFLASTWGGYDGYASAADAP
ncbi:MAG: transglycosylase family protein, partial [Acidimicrobiaceae bacterium]|nr:transglycosylase family protein [Acidimicrobiaceae bacterium]